MDTRFRDISDAWGGDSLDESPSPLESRDENGVRISLRLRSPQVPPFASEIEAPPALPIEPATYDAWNADRLKRSSPPPSGTTPVTPIPPQRPSVAPPEPDAADDAFALVSRSTSTLPALDLVSEMAERFALGDFTGCLRAAELVLGQNPEHAVAQHYAREAHLKLEALYRSRLDAQGRVPVLAVPENELRWLGLDPQVGHLLSRIDGAADYDQVISASGMPKLAALRTLVELVDGRVVRLM